MKSVLLSVIVATYCVAAMTRGFLPGELGWVFGLLVFHFGAGSALRFVTNSKLFAAGIAFAAIAVEIAVLHSNRTIAIWVGTLVELAPSVYFAQRFVLTMGD